MLLAIVPAYNEENRIGSVVRSLLLHADTVAVIDDGSRDRTAEEAAGAGAVVLRHAFNRGQGAALETGQEYARAAGAEYVLHFDGDGQFSADDISPALEAMKKEQADVLFGSRFIDGGSKLPWVKKHILLPIGRIVSALFGSPALTDVHNGFRMLNRTALLAIHITHDRMAHATEIPALAKRCGLRYIEFPVHVVYREYGQGAAAGAEIIKDLAVGKLLMMRGRR